MASCNWLILTMINLILLLLLCIFASICLAVDLNLNSSDDEQLTQVRPVARWIELHKQIFDHNSSGNDLNLGNVKNMLLEMSTIEQTDMFKVENEPINQILDYHIKEYKQLVRKSWDLNLIDNLDVTVTNLILQTLDINSTNCTEKYFKQLDEIYGNMEHIPLARFLQENRQLQHKFCWNRYMDLLRSNCMLLSNRAVLRLDKLVAAYKGTDPSLIINLTRDEDSPKFRDENLQIDKAMMSVIHRAESPKAAEVTNESYNKKLKHHFIQQCQLLIDETNYMMKKIIVMLGIRRNSSNFMTADHALMINRFRLCERILAIRDLFSPNVIESIYDRTDKPLTTRDVIPDKTDKSKSLIELGMDASHRLNSKIGSSSKQTPSQTSVPAQLPANKQIKDLNAKSVITIGHSEGRGVKTKYPVLWSDGTTSYEKRSYLEAFCPDEFDIQLKRQAADRYAKFVERHNAKFNTIDCDQPDKKRQRNDIDINIPSSTSANRVVISIEHGSGRGINFRYPTNWSDGSRSSETRDYLVRNWPEIWQRRFE